MRPTIDRRVLLAAAALGPLVSVVRTSAAPAQENTMGHVVLLGDSVFDNGAYVPHGREVVISLRPKLPAGWTATLAAVDGAVIRDVHRQLAAVPAGATHLLISAGGNDALREAGVMTESARSVAEALQRLAAARDRFEQDYRAMLDSAEETRLPVAICTIYEANFPDPMQRRIAATALTVLNDVITREAARRGLPLIDLRVLFSEDADYANAIEPSGRGGAKLAGAIAALVATHDFDSRRAAIFVR